MHNPEFNLDIFLLGCIGAIAPEIVRLYNLRTNPQFTWSWFYLVVSTLFALLGGLIAWVLPSTTYYGAFYAGVTTPVLITTIIRNREPTQQLSTQETQGKEENQIQPQAAPVVIAKSSQKARKQKTISELFRDYWQSL